MRQEQFTVVVLMFLITASFIPTASGLIVNVEKDFLTMIIPDSEEEGFEPHILAGTSIDGDQWYYVDSPTGLGNTVGQGGNLWISKDYGETWEWYDKDMFDGSGRSGDSYTAVNQDGTIYFTDLYLSTASVDWSNDGGETWTQNPFGSEYVLVDRQWFLIGPDGSGGEILYFSYNQLASGLHMVKSRMIGNQGWDWQPCNGGLPISSDVGSRDNFAVDPNNGNVYHANWQSNGIYCYVSTNYGESFSSRMVEAGTSHAAAQNTFIDMDVDTAGNVYMMWSSREHIMLGISTDEGSSWNVINVTETPGTRVFPWIAAGDEGRIAMAWYETDQVGNPNNLDDAWWDFLVGISINALDGIPTFEVVTLDPDAHYGSVRTSGLDGDDGPEPDRDLGDYIGIDIDEFGRAITVWGHDGDDGTNARQLPIWFGRQNEGPFLYKVLEPFYIWTLDGNELRVDGSVSQGNSTTTITRYHWDWGDGSTSTGETAKHTYSGTGTFSVTLTISNEINQTSKITMSFDFQNEDDEGEFPTGAAFGGALLLIIIVLLVWFMTKRKRTADEPAPPVAEAPEAGIPASPPPEPPAEVEVVDEAPPDIPPEASEPPIGEPGTPPPEAGT